MATITKERARLAWVDHGYVPMVKMLPEGGACTHKQGAALWLTASGRVRPLIGTGKISKGDIGYGIAGLALQDGGNSTGSNTEVPVLIATSNTVFEGNVGHYGVAASSTIGYSMLGSVHCASVNSSRIYLKKGGVGATDSLLLCVGFKDAINDLYGRVYFKFLHCAFDKSR